MAKISVNFDGAKFAQKYNLGELDFWAMSGSDELYCPSLPMLKDEDLLDCLITSPTPQTEITFDFSPKVHDDPLEAIKEAIAEGLKKDKSMAVMVLSLAKGMLYILDNIEKTDERLKKGKL